MQKDVNKIVAVLILVVVSIAIIKGCIYFLNFKFSNKNPSEPVTHGDFPTQPYWILKADQDVISTPATDNKFLFVKTSSFLYAIDIVQKNVVWKTDSLTDYELSFAPLVTDSSVIVVENGSSLAAYSIDSGKLLWKTSTIEGANYVTASVQSIAFNSEYLYVGRFDWSLTAYNLKTGEIIWEQNLPGRTNPYVEANEEYVFLGVGETLSIFEANYGRPESWKKDDIGYAGPILLSENTLYIADEKYASLISLDVRTHVVTWEKDYQAKIKTYNYSCILETEKYLLVAARKLMMVSKLDGEILWSTDDLGILECPILLGNKIYVRNSLTTLYSIDKETGHEVGQMLVQMNSSMKHDFFRGPVAVDGFLAVPFGDNRVFIYQP